MDNLARIRYITRNLDSLQGLRMVPFGLFLLAAGFGWLGDQGDFTLSLPAFVLTLFLYWLLGRYYARKFGRVKPLRAELVKNTLLSLAVILLMWVASWLDYWLNPPVSIFGLTLAVLLFAWWWLDEQRIRFHYALMAGLVALISLLPLIGIGEGWQIIEPMGSLFHLLIGGIVLIGGILDHLILVNGFTSSGGLYE